MSNAESKDRGRAGGDHRGAIACAWAGRMIGVTVLLIGTIAATASRAAGTIGTHSASGSISITISVPLVTRILSVMETAEGYEYRVWTNGRVIVIGSVAYPTRVGENVIAAPKMGSVTSL